MKKYTKDTGLNEMLNTVAEISLCYNYKVKAKDRVKATNAEELSKAFFSVYDKGSIEVTETSYCALYDQWVDYLKTCCLHGDRFPNGDHRTLQRH